MATTPGGLPYPVGTDLVVNGDDAIKALAEALDALLLGQWTPYAPVLTGITLGNGTLTARYRKIGRTVNIWFVLTLGSTSSVTGVITLGLVSQMFATFGAQVMTLGAGESLNAGVFTAVVATPSTATAVLFRTAAGASVSPGIPGTWVAGSQLAGQLSYESAT